MSKENEQTSTEKEKSGLRIAQIFAAALAAVTAALLGSTIGVAGTVVGAGLASVITTVGGELYLRSLRRTRQAARKARLALATSGMRRRGPLDLAEQPTVQLPRPDMDAPPEEEPGRLRKLRWPLIIGTSALAFVVALMAIIGFESATGTPVGGGTGPAIGKIFGGGSGHTDPTNTPVSDSVPTPTPTTPTTTPSTPTTSSKAPSTSSSAPTTTTPPSSSVSSTPTQGATSTPTP